MTSYNQQLIDRAVRHAILLEQYKRGEAVAVLRLHEREVVAPLVSLVNQRLLNIAGRGHDISLLSSTRGKFLATAIKALLDEGYSTVNQRLMNGLTALTESEVEWQLAALRQVAKPLSIEFAMPNVGRVQQIVLSRPLEGAPIREWTKQLPVTTYKRVTQAISQGLAAGQSHDTIVQNLRGTKAERYTNGVLQSSRRDIDSLVRTASNHVTSHAREVVARENDDIVRGVRIVATLDTRTTPVCRSQDGKIYPIDDGPRPPFHWRCRTTTTPVLKTAEEAGLAIKIPVGVRASMNGPVAGNETYGSWLKRQSASVQEEALGPARARLFRSGKVSIDKFVDETGRTLTLKELKSREGL